MATQRQKKLAKAIIENIERKEPKNAKELLVSSGYTQSSAESVPGKLIEQKGVQEELEKLGFTEYNAKSVVASIMNDNLADKNARLKAADMTFKVHGSYAPEKHEVQANIKGSITSEVLEIAEEELKKRKLNDQ